MWAKNQRKNERLLLCCPPRFVASSNAVATAAYLKSASIWTQAKPLQLATLVARIQLLSIASQPCEHLLVLFKSIFFMDSVLGSKMGGIILYRSLHVTLQDMVYKSVM